MTASVTFDAMVTATGSNTGIAVPDELIERLGAGRRPAVIVNVNGCEYQNIVGVMGGQHMISISAAVRKDARLKAGDQIHVVLTLADGPHEVTVPRRPGRRTVRRPGGRGVLREAIKQSAALPRRQH